MVGLSETDPDIVEGPYFLSWCALPLYGSIVSCLLWLANLVRKELGSYSSRPGDANQFPSTGKDEDVLAEEARVEAMVRGCSEGASMDATHVQGLLHTYRTRVGLNWVETNAVRGVSFGVRGGECFGLLGPNGAGKTTTLAVLTGLVRPPSAGVVNILGYNIAVAAEMSKACLKLGVCPQEDPLWETVTGREHLLFYGKLKGVPAATLTAKVSAILYRLGFENADADKPAGQYSGGMKRKLSLAIALIAQPPLLFLDEPSAAVDAAAKRHLWKVIKMRSASQSVVLTTHSMEEAEALCDRIAIQVKGQLRCLGPPHHIKRKYGSGYQLEVFCHVEAGTGGEPGQSQCERFVGFVQERLSPEVRLLEHHAGRYLFQLPPIRSGPGSLTLGMVFTELQRNRECLGIIDYSLAQASLEQVFIRFAREQEQVEEAPALPQPPQEMPV